MTYTEFKQKWLGRRVDIDSVYGFQCVDLVKQYIYERWAIPNGAYGNAIDWWYKTHSTITSKFDKFATGPKQGDIVIFKGVNGSPFGHIGIVDSSNLLHIYTLEQNGATGGGSGAGGDAIRVRGIPRWRMVGLLRRKPTTLYHTVVSGDTLTSIANKYKTTVPRLIQWNKAVYPSLATNPNYLKIGWKLRVR